MLSGAASVRRVFMAEQSYTLQETASRLGISRRALQRRIQDGEFPERFLAPGPHGPELRIPASALSQEAPSERPRGALVPAPTPTPTAIGPAPDWGLTELPASKPAPLPSSLTHTDLESLRDAVIAIVREEREVFLASMQSVLDGRDAPVEQVERQLSELGERLGGLQSAFSRVEGELSRWWKSEAEGSETWAEVIGAEQSPTDLDVDELLQEPSSLESMLELDEEL